MSLVTAHNHERHALTNDKDKRRFNVATSRAKDQMWLFHSVQPDDIKNHNDLRYKLLEHITTYNTPQFELRKLIPIKKLNEQPTPFRSWFEVEVYNDILARDCQVIPAYKVAGYEIDLVVLCADGTKIAVECDGDYWHSDKQYDKDMERQDILERAGWQFFRIRYSHYINDRNLATQGLWEILDSHSIKTEEAKTNQQDNLDQQKTKPQEKLVRGKQLEIIEPEPPPIFEQNKDKESQILLFLNLYQSGNYVISQTRKEDADFSLTIDKKYQNGYLLQCYDNGRINKFDVSVLSSRKLDREYKNGFNLTINNKIPKLLLIEKDEIIGITFVENGEKKFKAHLTETLPMKDNLSIQGRKVIYNEHFTGVRYDVISITEYSNIKKLVLKSFNTDGKKLSNKYYDREWQNLKKLINHDKYI